MKFLKRLRSYSRWLRPKSFQNTLLEAEAIFESLVQQGQIPGCAIGISIGGETVYQRQYGKADIEKSRAVTPATVFRIASVSKPITGVALAKLAENGVLQLDEDIRKYVPEFPEKQQRITLRQLASHTAGIRGYRGKEYALNRPITIAEGIDIFKDDPLIFDPGTGYHYNSYDFVLLSLAMQRADSRPFKDLVDNLVLMPMQMEHTTEESPGKLKPNQAVSYSRSFGKFAPATAVDTRFKLAGGGYLSNVPDLLKFGNAILSDRMLQPGTKKEMLSPHTINGQSTYYGLGWQVSEDMSGRAYYGHVGNTVGGYSNFYIFPDTEKVFALLINCTDPKVQPMLDLAWEKMHHYWDSEFKPEV